MCGILYYLKSNNSDISLDQIKDSIKNLSLRGPDNSQIVEIDDKNIMGFTRLAINDLSENGNQPLIIDNTYYLICNGEIYNHKKLSETYDFNCKSNSDCEVIIHLYKNMVLIILKILLIY